MNQTTDEPYGEPGGFEVEPRPLVSRLREIDATIRDFAREQPLLTAAAAISLGYVFGRMLRKL